MKLKQVSEPTISPLPSLLIITQAISQKHQISNLPSLSLVKSHLHTKNNLLTTINTNHLQKKGQVTINSKNTRSLSKNIVHQRVIKRLN